MGNKVDMYALGVVLFEMFAAYLPERKRQNEILLLRDTGRIHPHSKVYDICPPAAKLVAKLLSYEPDDRPSARQVLGSDDLPFAEPQDLTPALEAYMARSLKKLQEENRVLRETLGSTQSNSLTHSLSIRGKRSQSGLRGAASMTIDE